MTSMNFKKKAYTNKLTDDINQGNMSLEDVLSSDELSMTIRNEPEPFLNYFFPPEEMAKTNPELPKLDELIKLALEPDDSKKQKYKLCQLNRNASNVLSHPSDRMQGKLREDKSKRFFKALRKFIFNEKINQDPMFAGHFQRIFETVLRKSANDLLDKDNSIKYDDQFTEEAFIKFIIENSQLLSYRELLSAIISEFSEHFPTAIDETLRYAAIATLHINDIEKKQFRRSQNPQYFKIDPAALLNEKEKDAFEKKLNKFILDNQPKNCAKETMPIPYYINRDSIEYTPVESENCDDFIEKIKSTLKYETVKAENIFHSKNEKTDNMIDLWKKFALNLIYGFKNAYEFDINDVIKTKLEEEAAAEDNNIIQCLLICGMFADSESSLSYTSFNLLFNLLNERHRDQDDMYDDKYILNLHPPKIIDEYAEHFVFDPYEVTEAMISGLLVFWNHRYPDPLKNGEKTKGEQVLPDYTTQVGISALELLLPTILTEPIFSSKLNNIFIRIITSLEQEIIDAIEKERKEKADSNSTQNKSKDSDESDQSAKNRCFEIDSIWYELLTYKFKLSPNDPTYITLPKALEKLLPLPTTDEFYHIEEIIPEEDNATSQLFRATTNPVFFMLSNIINHGAFFAYGNGRQFRELFKESFDREWAFQSFIYYHIIDKMKKELIKTPFVPVKPEKIKVDDKPTKEDEKQSQLGRDILDQKLSDSWDKKKGKKKK